jgi:SRSO17 transposase
MNGSTPDVVDQDASVVPGGAAYLHDLECRLAPYVERTEPPRRTMAYLRGLLSPAEHKNSWQLAEVSGDATPYAALHVLRRVLWDPETARDELRRYVLQYLADPETVLVLDETDFLKKGRHSTGVARQYSGTTGKVDNCRVAVFLGYAGPLGHAWWTVSSLLPTSGPTTESAASTPEFRQTATLRPRRSGPAQWVMGNSPISTHY